MEDREKQTETPVDLAPTGVSFVPFCSFPGLSAVWRRMAQLWVKGLTHTLTHNGLKTKWRKTAVSDPYLTHKAPDFC